MNTADKTAQKKRIRLQIKKQIQLLPKAVRDDQNSRIQATLLAKDYFKAARRIFIYLSKPDEVSTAEVVKAALQLGKQVLVPRVLSKTKFDVVRIQQFTQISSGAYGIPEPPADLPGQTDLSGMDLMIIPGLAFTQDGHRLGRGGGYFDRFLESKKGIKKVGLAYREQILNKLPVESHDIQVDEVITDSI